MTGSTVDTHVSVGNVETDNGTFWDLDTSHNESGQRNVLLAYYTPTWQKNYNLGNYGDSVGSQAGSRIGKFTVNDVGPWEHVHNEMRGLGLTGGEWTSPSSANWYQRSATRRQMIFLA